MNKANIYLNFNGNCQEAFDFYKSVFKGEYTYLGRYKDAPEGGSSYINSSEDKEKILHVSLPISENTILMGCDYIQSKDKDFILGNNFSISISADSKHEADRLFKELAEGGQIEIPLKEAFWGDYFGQLTDRYGINWMLMVE